MMDVKSKADSFGTFLESLQRSESAQQAPVPASSAPRILATLADSDPRPMSDLLPLCGLPFTEFADVVKTMQQAELVAVPGAPGQEQIEITPQGRQVARLAV